MKKSIIIQTVLILIITSCSSHSQGDCNLKEIKTLFTIPGVYEGKIGYSHYVLIRNFNRKCLDSTRIINMALKYRDTIERNKPVDVLMLFNSDKDFIPNESSQVMEEINKSCLVVIGFNENTGKPNDFIFYNDKGDRTFWGKKWLPGINKR